MFIEYNSNHGKEIKYWQYSMAETVNIVIVEGNQRMREGLKALIEGTTGFNCVGSFPDFDSMFDRIDFLKPDIILMDFGSSVMNSIDGIKRIQHFYPDIQSLVLTIHEEDDIVYNAFCAGARGYLLKQTSPSQLIEAILDIYKGGSPMSSNIARKVVNYFQNKRTLSGNGNGYHFTSREKEILQALVDGLSCKAIAEKMFITIEAVRFHFRNIYKKLNVHSQAELIAKVIKEQLV
jgi:DNA-binding NarL/FixJ family response regulator